MRNRTDRRRVGLDGGVRLNECPICGEDMGAVKKALILMGEEGANPTWMSYEDCSFCNHRRVVDDE